MITVVVHDNGQTSRHEAIDPQWLSSESDAWLWVDLTEPTPEEARVLRETFHFHELAIEDALSSRHHPKIEPYDGYLYAILHGIDFQAAAHHFATHDTDFFIGPRYLVTLHDATVRSVPRVRELCLQTSHIMDEGVVALAHRIMDSMVDNYRPEVDKLRDRIDAIEAEVFENPDPNLMRDILALKRDVSSLRAVVLPQRDVVGRLARREFQVVNEAMAFRFRDVYDHLVRLSDEALYFQDRISSLLDAHLSAASNRLNQVMKVLTLIATVFMPMTVVTSVYGMNMELPRFPGGAGAQFYWVLGLMSAVTAAMLWFFRSRDWL